MTAIYGMFTATIYIKGTRLVRINFNYTVKKAASI
jgi:hypothetical protein